MANRTDIFTGFWIDRSHSTVEGATVTLTTQNAAYLLAFLATYVSIAGGFFWSIIAFVIHQLGATKHGSPTRQDGFRWKVQIILRNTSGPLATSWKIAKLSHASRGNGKNRKFQWTPLLVIVFALLISAAFAVATIFSSLVTKAAGEDVLLHADSCPIWLAPAGGLDQSWNTKIILDSTASAAYARACYASSKSPNADRPEQCDIYVNKELNWKANTSAPCPFVSGMCLVGDTGAFEMDTGPINSHDDLGINSPVDGRLTVRRVTTCSPIISGIFTQEVTVTTGGGEWQDPWLLYNYGPYAGVNYTYFYNIHALLESYSYGLAPVFSYAGYSYPDQWSPIPELNRTDADLSLFFLTPNSVRYQTMVDDPWFSAHTLVNYSAYGLNESFYEADKPVQVMACTDQYQFCKPNIKQSDTVCTALAGIRGTLNASLTLGLSDLQTATLARLYGVLEQLSISNTVNGRGAFALSAMETLYLNIQVPLPSNQWTIEVGGWFTTSLAWLQQATVEFATGPANPPDAESFYYPADPGWLQMCHSQKVGKTAGYQNFSLLGICIIVIIGGLIIATGIFINSIVGTIQKCLKRKGPGLQAWKDDEDLELAETLMSEGIGESRTSEEVEESEPKTRMISVHRDVEDDVEEMFLNRN